MNTVDVNDYNNNKKTPPTFLGILMLDTRFPRILGDAGNIDSYDFDAKTEIVRNAGSLDIVKDGLPSTELINAFCESAKKLEAQGAFAIISTCGFLVSIQYQIQSQVKIPVMLSALSMYQKISAQQKVKKPIAILTASKQSLGSMALSTASIKPDDVIIEGMQDCPAFANAFLKEKSEQLTSLDEDAIEKAVLEKIAKILTQEPKVDSILLECGNLPPYAQAITEATGLKVYSILDSAQYFYEQNLK